MKHLFHLLYALSLLAFVSCTTTPVQSPATFTLSWEKGHSERKEWTDLTASLVRENLSTFSNASDVAAFCPKYKQLDDNGKVHVWSELVSSISKFESAWNPSSTYQEPQPPAGPGTLSVGLLQMSTGDPYPNCFSKSDSSNLLKDPSNNLKCGLSAMTKLIAKDGVIVGTGSSPYKGLTRYWSVSKKSHHLSEIQAMVKKVPGC